MLERLHGISISLSARSVADDNFMASLLRDAESAHLPTGKLCFELTETAVIEHRGDAAEVIAAFPAIGCGFKPRRLRLRPLLVRLPAIPRRR
ncbi:MAG: hypothetical protein NVS9B10_05490 [Nevskia sp.]